MMTEENYEEAFEEAKLRDKERLESIKNGTQDKLPALHGIPISIKDQLFQKGKYATIGIFSYCDKVMDFDAPSVSLLNKAGAIILVRSNVPQGCLSSYTYNEIWGLTTNPRNPARTAGGSSGGEGALIASKCTPAGIGTDLGGSIRIPCNVNGLCGFKFTFQRTSNYGVRIP